MGTYQLKPEDEKALRGVTAHFRKAHVLLRLARRLAPQLEIDLMQIHTQGYTPAVNAEEFSAVIEEVFTELYSSIDCARFVIVATNKGCKGMPTNSTRKLFRAVTDKKISADFPAPIRQAITDAHWYNDLLFLRDALTHSNIGNCHLDRATKVIFYMHQDIMKAGKTLVIDNIIEHAIVLCKSVEAFLKQVFAYLNTQLKPYVVDEVCGIFYSRVYTRTLPSATPITWDSGTCTARHWFDKEAQRRCPFADSCGAYGQVEPPALNAGA